jgi:hypothetical protein
MFRTEADQYPVRHLRKRLGQHALLGQTAALAIALSSAITQVLAADTLGTQTDPEASVPQNLAVRPALRGAMRDPFNGFTQPPAMSASAKQINAGVARPVVAELPAAPQAPALELVFLGRLWQDGSVQVLARQQAQILVLQAGTSLPNGYVVKAVGTREVKLNYAPLNHEASWQLPAPPAFETR